MRLLILLFLLFFCNILYAGTFEVVKNRGHLICGVSISLPGFSYMNKDKEWKGINVDYCRAIAVAVFGNPEKVVFVPLAIKDSFIALKNGDVDILSKNTTWTLERDSSLGINFVGVSYYDTQGFLILKDFGIKNATKLNRAYVCMVANSSVVLNVKDYFEKQNMKYYPILLPNNLEAQKSFIKQQCDVLASDKSVLYSFRSKMKNSMDYMVLPESISSEPLGPVVREGDDLWFNISKWTLNVLILAEEFGLNKKNVNLHIDSNDKKIQRLLGVKFNSGAYLNLSTNWSFNIILSIGNYKDIFDRNLGENTVIDIDRGMNYLWKDGGLMYAMPFR